MKLGVAKENNRRLKTNLTLLNQSLHCIAANIKTFSLIPVKSEHNPKDLLRTLKYFHSDAR